MRCVMSKHEISSIFLAISPRNDWMNLFAIQNSLVGPYVWVLCEDSASRLYGFCS